MPDLLSGSAEGVPAKNDDAVTSKGSAASTGAAAASEATATKSELVDIASSNTATAAAAAAAAAAATGTTASSSRSSSSENQPPLPSTPEKQQLPQKNQPQRRSARSSSALQQDPVIAPGFGTAQDLQRLARDLSAGASASLPVEAVRCMMESRGRGIRSSSRRSGTDDTTNGEAGTASSSSVAATPVSSAWADFMKEEGVGNTSSAVAVASASASASATGKRTRTEVDSKNDAATGSNTNTAVLDGAKRIYNLDELKTGRAFTTKKSKKEEADEGESGGVLLQTGTLNSAVVGRSKAKSANPDAPYNLWIPTRLLPKTVTISKVFAAGHACHSLALSTTGACYGWGRNDHHQLGGLASANVHQPTPLEGLPSSKEEGTVVTAALGRSHTLLVFSSGNVYAVGLNKVGQCGVKSSSDAIATFRKCVFRQSGDDNEDEDEKTIIQVSCGDDFSAAVCDEGFLYTTGSSEYGKLGNGETGEYFVSANKLAFSNESAFTKRKVFCHAPNEKLHVNNDTSTKVVPLAEDVRIQQVACGKNHAIALEANADGTVPRLFSWGCGDYGVLGHGVQANEFFPRCIGTLTRTHWAVPGSGSNRTTIAAGQVCSLLQTAAGHVYYWGKHRPVGEATMRPTVMESLANNQHVVTAVSAGGLSVVCSTTKGRTVAWGQCIYGGLGLGTKKSTSQPDWVTSLDGCRVSSIACGYGHTLFVVRNDDKEDKAAVDKLPMLGPSATEELENEVEPAPPAATKRKNK